MKYGGKVKSMKLTDIISKKAIIPALKATDKKGVVAELAAIMKKAYPDDKLNAADIVAAIMEREEKVGSTGLHGGVAIPHARLSSVKEIRGAFGRAAKPVDFRAVDGEPSYLFFLIVSPPAKSEAYLEALKRLTLAIKSPHFCKFLRQAKSAKEIEETLKEVEETAKV